MINPMLKAKLIKRGISELSLIITVNCFQAVEMLIVQPQSQALKVLKHFILALQEENPRVTLILGPQVISRPRGGLHNWVRQTPQSFETTVLDTPQMTSRLRGGSHDWVRQTSWSFEITTLESIIKHRIQTEF
jgi:hypothetical protein